MVRWMAFNSCPGYQLNKRWKNDKIDVLEGKTFYAINTKTCGTQKKMDDKNLVKNWKNILTLANVHAYIYMYIIKRINFIVQGNYQLV